MSESQRVLSEAATEAFDHGWLFPAQIEHFSAFTGFDRDEQFRLLDVGGGTGLFAQSLQTLFPKCSITILDISARSLEKAAAKGLNAMRGSILEPPAELRAEPFDVVVFNMILHHLVGDSDKSTEDNQRNALRNAGSLLRKNGRVFLNEYCYTGFLSADLSGRLIYEMTSSQTLARILRTAGHWVPSLAANTVGVGVRFRPLQSWAKLGVEAGLKLEGTIDGPLDPPSISRKSLLLIREVRRSSAAFVRTERSGEGEPRSSATPRVTDRPVC